MTCDLGSGGALEKMAAMGSGAASETGIGAEKVVAIAWEKKAPVAATAAVVMAAGAVTAAVAMAAGAVTAAVAMAAGAVTTAAVVMAAGAVTAAVVMATVVAGAATVAAAVAATAVVGPLLRSRGLARRPGSRSRHPGRQCSYVRSPNCVGTAVRLRRWRCSRNRTG
ncbi:hypothetical protein PLESTB_000589400 [Pleodorina starrii]|uniref:Uncharacterized protein n=1 Tax=Pleodorina starrii TaxID=330485 RepID=A0A9W6BHL9_9CHLO|nr:hypothetical protein PLESTM_000762700 [Pleodorina starrii]GLC52158.1 hypothetical protein PLESTB_000589400 [Pleodorina starrii]GLC75785.1 hypothetical protein PLESTF_001687200 [Pleodorina starrii]